MLLFDKNSLNDCCNSKGVIYLYFPPVIHISKFVDISKTVNSRINIPGTQINAAYDQYADSRSIER